MLRQLLTMLLLVLVAVNLTSGLFRRRRTTIIHNHQYTNTNNCLCNTVILGILNRLSKLEKKVGRRDVADLLDLEEDYPGLDNLLDHLDTKRDGSVDKTELESLLTRATSSSSAAMSNICHCGRSVVDDFNLGLL